ncbi:serine/threonine protein kinase [Aliifodinibius salipaludis]|uniref:Serine/threonine protein kinase n=1 Tax=Fodinibius salipaludis TaxID=2032627 RepID=A0A2A2G7E8_9BACT|nr:serine/threonine-protein kinase [Aliifodinibius salipaludis]PAU92792.1 serine/threonine protein kinase [Aliifodinibius salipaludis]
MDKIHHYEIKRELGAGQHGTVYYATDTRLKRPVVIKIVHPERAKEKQIREQILEEAQIASAIQHPNVSTIYEVGEYEERPYIIMQYVPGRTLAELLQDGSLNLQFALSISIQIAEGLAEAHKLGILHRDLKPANIMVTDGGLVKILDFGLAKRREISEIESITNEEQTSNQTKKSSQFGTTAYMAPEQFITLRSSNQSDIFSLGVILYEIVTGQHPFLFDNNSHETDLIRIIRSVTPTAPHKLSENIPKPLSELIVKALDKQPSNRFESVTELHDALKTLMKSMDFEKGMIPGERSALLPSPSPSQTKDSEKKNNRNSTGLISMLTEFFLQKDSQDIPENSIAVLPFKQISENGKTQYFGLAMADAIATRLSQNASVVIRPPSTFLSLSDQSIDDIEAGKKLETEYVLTGSFFSTDEEFTLNWQLIKVTNKEIQAGNTVSIPSFDLLKVQSEITEQVFDTLFSLGKLEQRHEKRSFDNLPIDLSEQYLEAQALLSRFLWGSNNPKDLIEGREKFEEVLEQAPDFAAAHAGLGRTHLNYVTNGYGGPTYFMKAQGHLGKALELDPDNVEAKLQRAYTFLWRGEKDRARRDIQYLLKNDGRNTEVLLGAGIIVQLDGLHREALRLLGKALQKNPAAATQIYNRRARLNHYLGQLDLAWLEVDKGLTLEPKHSLLRTTKGYLFFSEEAYEKAVPVLESVIEEDPNRRVTYPTLAMCYVKNDQPEKAHALITDELLTIAATDCEMAFRLASYFAVDGNHIEALHWLRKAIYLGYENYPWIKENPIWKPLRNNEEFKEILSDLERVFTTNQTRWMKFLNEFWEE